MLNKIIKDLQEVSSKTRAKQCLRFFKTGKGQYGAGDKFVGVRGPDQRIIAKKYVDVNFNELQKLITSSINEYRQVAFLILVYKYKKAKSEKEKTSIFNFYIKNRRQANNWNLVDVAAWHVVGQYMNEFTSKKDLLYTYAKSKNIWERRIAIVSTYAFIRQNNFTDTLKIAKMLLHDQHDLIHKAVGWMLREVGNRDQKTEEQFLQKYYKTMPRTMLRYAIEKFPEKLRKQYLKNKII